jgi:DNA invertase Pin-like site-specific DNA recombinase
MNIALYTRVSTEDQSVNPQLLELREYAARNGMTIVAEYTDVISGAKAQRPGLDALLANTANFSLVLAVKMDRLGRSVLNVVSLVQRLKKMGVSIICTSQGIDNRDENPCGTMVMNIMASFAEFERAIIIDRTKAGLRNAKANGKILGRVSTKLIPEADRPAVIAAWKESGDGLRVLAKNLGGVSPMTARKLAMEAVA